MLTGKRLIRDIDSCKAAAGLWWLGQHSFVLKLAGKVLYLDPFLSLYKGRRVKPLVKPEEVTNADLVFGSHDHADHIDRNAWPGIAQASPKAKFVVPQGLLPGLAGELNIPVKRFVGINDGKTKAVAGVRITGVAAAHEFLDLDARTGCYPYMGFVVKAGGVTLYHSGDCCVYEGLSTKLRRWKFDVVFLPINGRDAVRYKCGCIGNMTYQEAADLAGAIKPRLTIPAHYEMFAGNSCDPQLFVDYMRVKYPKLAVRVCTHGRRFLLWVPGSSKR